MSDSDASSHHSDNPFDDVLHRRTLVELIVEFDAARARLLNGQPANTPFNELNRRDVEAYIQLVLAGQTPDFTSVELITDDGDRHVFLDPRTTLTRDIDSALIFREDFPWTTSYDVFTTYESRKSLRDHLHAQLSFTDPTPGVAPEYRDPGKDPNVLWGVCGNNGGRNRIYLMLPGAEDETMNDLHPLIYNATLNAARDVNAFSTTTWSPTYQIELDRTASFTRSRFRTESRKSVPQETGRTFANEFMTSIRRFSWGSGAYWFIQIRGAKDITRDHRFDRLTQPQLDTILGNIDLNHSVVYVDLGLEIHLPEGYAAMPDRRRENHVGLAEALWAIDPQEEWDYKDYSPDPWAGVADIAGYRCNYASDPITENLISYVQVYTTDKFQTYNTSGTFGGALQVFPPSVLKMANPDDMPQAITKVYSATQTNLSQQTPTATRFEARVPLHRAFHLDQLGVEIEDIAPFLIVLPSRAIWAWRIHRLYACYLLIKYAASMSLDAKRDTQYLTLVAAVVYMFNSIHSRPGEMSWQKQLGKVVFPIKSVEEDPNVWAICLRTPSRLNQQVPIMRLGAMWFPEIIFPQDRVTGALRFTYEDKRLTDAQLGDALGMKLADIMTLFTQRYLAYPNGKGMARKRTKRSDPPIKNRVISLPMRVTDGQYNLPPTYFDHAPDLPPSAMVGEAPAVDPTRRFSQFFIGYLCQVMQRVGTIANTHIRYCKLSDDEIRYMNPDTFRDMNISTYLVSYQFTKLPKAWSGNFEILFPGRGSNVIALAKQSVQGWRGIPMYEEWLKLRDDPMKRDTFDALRGFCKQMYNSLKWFPRVSTDRVFDNKARTTWTKVFAGDLTTGTPITINPSFAMEPITAMTDQPPVLSCRRVGDDDENEAEYNQLQVDHQGTVPDIAREVFGDEAPVNLEPVREPPPSAAVIAFARARYSRKRGRQLVDLDSSDEEDRVSNALLGI
ncbi:hypothetical protein EV361DRAFT_1020375 [Lentinula raphanica]|nr:hypothetical protein EV361DRAFT_1020375 [Lentinula raphanica]